MLGILSDAHGNGPAFDFIVERLEKLGARRFLFLGDAVGYIPSTSVVRSLLALKDRVSCVRGNHEEMLLGESIDPKRDAVYQLALTRQLLTPQESAFIASWPTSRLVPVSQSEAMCVHGSPADVTNGYVYPDTDLDQFSTRAAFVFMGHSHHPFVRRHGKTTFVNVGSCGLPRDDGRFGAAVLLDEEQGRVRLLRFNIERATSVALSNVGSIHPSVASVFGRRKDDVAGELHAD